MCLQLLQLGVDRLCRGQSMPVAMRLQEAQKSHKPYYHLAK
jgi:hypothetical protein